MPTSFSILFKFFLDDFREGRVYRFVPRIFFVHKNFHGGITHSIRGLKLYLILHQHIQKISISFLIIIGYQIWRLKVVALKE